MTGGTGPGTSNAPGTGGLPIVDVAGVDPPARHRVGGVVLAAGESRRYGGRNKLLVPVGQFPMVRRSTATLLRADLDPVVAVLGHQAGRVRGGLDGLGITCVLNDAYARGQGHSIAAGVRAVAHRVDALVIALGDMPDVEPATVDAIVTAYETGAGTAIAPVHDGHRGNPVLFDATHFEALKRLDGDRGARRILLEGDTSVLVAVDDPGVRRDIDRPEDH